MAVTNVTLVAQPQSLSVAGGEVAVLSVSPNTAGGVFVWYCDLGAMANGDVVELRIYSTIAGGGSERLSYYAVYSHAQAQPMKFSVPVPALATDSIRMTLKETAGAATISVRSRIVTIG